MRLFQNNGLSRGFRVHRTEKPYNDFIAGRDQFLDTRFTASHILWPVYSGNRDAFYTNGDDRRLQQQWAKEQGLRSSDLELILLAQIEHHRADVFYNLDPMRYGSAFVKKLPGCVKKAICWRSAPSGNADLSGYDLVVSNFPSILDSWQRKGCKVAYFFPAHDPVMDQYCGIQAPTADLIFIGGFSRHHKNRASALQAAAAVPGIKKQFHLEDSRVTRLINLLPFVPGLSVYRHPPEIRSIREGPIYGRDSYLAMAGARITFNGAVDMAGSDRGNMRCFEATGCGSILLTDAGNYPEGFVDGETMVVYSGAEQISGLIDRILKNGTWAESLARAGAAMVRTLYSKENQWLRFQELA